MSNNDKKFIALAVGVLLEAIVIGILSKSIFCAFFFTIFSIIVLGVSGGMLYAIWWAMTHDDNNRC